MYRPSERYRLEQGPPDKYTFTVCNYHVDPDTEIRFSHLGRPLIAPAYKSASGPSRCEAPKLSTIRSEVEIGHPNDDGQMIGINMGVTSTFDGYDIIYEVEYNQSDISVGIGGLKSAIESLDQPSTTDSLLDQIDDAAKAFSTTMEIITLSSRLDEDEASQLPPNIKDDDFLMFSPTVDQRDVYLKFSISVKEFEAAVHAVKVIALFDDEGRIISVGPVGLYLPLAKVSGDQG
jgi:hypothetical protein